MRATTSFAALVLISSCGGTRAANPIGGGGGGAGDRGDGGSGNGGGSGGGGGEAAVVALPAPPTRFATADLVALDGGELTAYSVAGGRLAALGSSKLAAPDSDDDFAGSLSGDWGDRDHFFVHLPPRTVLGVTATAITAVTVPGPSTFKTPRPKTEDDDGLTEGGVLERIGAGLVITDGAAWWAECPWGFPYDGWQCEVWVTARLWPTAEVVSNGDAVVARTWSWPSATASGFRTKLIDDDRELACTPPAGTRPKQTVFSGSESDGEHIYAHHWVSVAPPRLLIVYGSPGLADLVPSRWTLHDGCREQPLAQGTEIEPGPGGLWLAWESPDPKADEIITRQVVRRGSDIVGDLDGLVRFRPPAVP